MTEQRVSSRYARALLDTAVAENVADKIFEDFRIVNTVLEESHELRVFTSSPVIQHWRKKGVYKEIFEGNISTLTMAFLTFLLDKKRGELIRSIIVQYDDQYNRMMNRLPVEFTSALGLNDDLKKKLSEKIAEVTKKEVLPKYKTDPALQGGVLVRIDDVVYDSSILHQLELLYKKLAEEVN